MKAAALDPSEASGKIKHWQEKQRDFLKQTGLKRQHGRERIEAASVAPKALPSRKAVADIQIGRSVGAKSRNYDVIDKSTGEIYHFIEGTKIQNAEVFAGKGVSKSLREEVAEGLAKEFGGKPSDWQHLKGIAELDCGGEYRKAEVHWFQAAGSGKVKFKVKRWLDED